MMDRVQPYFALEAEIDTLGYPKATLFGFAVGFVSYSVLSKPPWQVFTASRPSRKRFQGTTLPEKSPRFARDRLRRPIPRFCRHTAVKGRRARRPYTYGRGESAQRTSYLVLFGDGFGELSTEEEPPGMLIFALV